MDLLPDILPPQSLPRNGKIELIAGCMFAGKTAALVEKIERYLIQKRKVVCIKWKGDKRYTDKPEIMTHSGRSYKCIPCDNEDLKTVYPSIKEFPIICIDEGCFFENIVPFCEFLADRGHHVIVASLVGTFERQGFGNILNLIPMCEDVIWKKAICMRCHKEGASFTKRVNTGTGEVVQVGGKDLYSAACRECFHHK